MAITVQLLAPLNQSAGWDRVTLALTGEVSLGAIVHDLAERFGPEFQRQIYDGRGQVIPAWCAFVNGRPIQLHRPENLATIVNDGDELALLLNVAGGRKERGNGDPTGALWSQGSPGVPD